jgi:hypothetical protein
MARPKLRLLLACEKLLSACGPFGVFFSLLPFNIHIRFSLFFVISAHCNICCNGGKERKEYVHGRLATSDPFTWHHMLKIKKIKMNLVKYKTGTLNVKQYQGTPKDTINDINRDLLHCGVTSY